MNADAGIGKIAKLFGQHVNINFQAYYNVEKPDNGPEWQLLFEISLLFPEH